MNNQNQNQDQNLSHTRQRDGGQEVTKTQRVLTAEQMRIFGRLNMDFIGWQDGMKGTLSILCNDRECNNATYAFCSNAEPEEIFAHVVEKRKQFRGDGDNASL